MQITFNCRKCGTSMEAASDLLGSESECPACHASLMVPQAHVAPGVRLGGYEIVRTIGRGAMGEVFLAKQVAMDRLVALKILPQQFAEDRDRIDRFLREARMSAKLDHPHVVTVLDAGEDTGFYYLAMQFIEGETMEHRLARTGPVPEAEALPWVAKVASGLEQAWERHQMLHRDIKPANIMVDKYGEPKLLDMGLAKTIIEDRRMTMTGSIVGTPLYMSPEQARTINDLDWRADAYSLGATLFHVLTGRPPFQSDSVVGLLAKHAMDPVPDPRTFMPSISTSTSLLLARMLAKDRAHRHRNWQEIIDQIYSGLGSSPPTRLGAAASTGAAHAAGTRPGSPPVALLEHRPPTPPRGQAVPLPPAAVPVAPPPPAGLPSLRLVAVVALLAFVLLGVIAALGIAFWPNHRRTHAQSPPSNNGIPNDPPVTPHTSPSPPKPTTDSWLPEDLQALPAVPATSTADPNKDKSTTQLAETFVADARAYLASHPQQLEAVISLYEDVTPRAAGTPQQAILEAELASLRARRTQQHTDRDAAIAAVFQDLRTRAGALAANKQPAAAHDLVDTYAGPWAAETVDARRQLADQYLHPAAPPPVKQVATNTALPDLQLALMQAALAGDFARVDRLMEGARKDPALASAKPTLDAMQPMLSRVAHVPLEIMHTFNDDISAGKEVLVAMKEGDERLEIRGELSGKVDARKVTVNKDSEGKTFTGRLPRTFSYDDLSMKEKQKRLAKPADATMAALLRVELQVEAGQFSAAKQAVSGLPEPWGPLASRALDELANGTTNKEAEAAFAKLLASAGMKNEPPSAALRTYSQLRLAPAVRNDQVRPDARALLMKYPASPVVKRYRDLLLMMGQQLWVPTGVIPVGDAALAPLAGLAPGAARVQELQTTAATGQLIPLEVENSVGMHFRLIPAAAADTMPGWESQPQHVRNNLVSYYLASTELTLGQWQAVMGTAHGEGAADLPVENLTYPEVIAFLAKLCALEGVPKGTYRLPLMPEWDLASRGGSTGEVFFDSTATSLNQYANYLDQSAPDKLGEYDLSIQRDVVSDGHARVAPVASYHPNAFGLYDILGNTYEYVTKFPEPPTPPGNFGPLAQYYARWQHGDFAMLRGGAWFTPSWDCGESPMLTYTEAVARTPQAGGTFGMGLRVLRQVHPPAGGADPVPTTGTLEYQPTATPRIYDPSNPSGR